MIKKFPFKALILLCLLFIFGGFFLYPPWRKVPSVISRSGDLHVPIFTLNRIIATEEILKEMLPPDSIYGLKVSIQNTGLGSNTIIIENGKFMCTVTSFITSTAKTESNILFKASLPVLSNPFERWKLNRFTRRTEDYLEALVSNIDLKSKDSRNVYGLHFKETTLLDSTLITIQKKFEFFPSTNDIYQLIDVLENYMNQHDAQPTNKPMLNIREFENNYQVMVALPINKELPNTSEIRSKRMLSGGKFIVSNVCAGGMWTFEQYEKNMENFIQDYSYVSPAIPFQSLLTNRMTEKDTGKWNTKLFYPVF